MNLGAAIKKVREEKKVTQIVLSKKTGLSQTAISQMESGDKWPHKSSLVKIAKALNVSLAYIMAHSLEEKDAWPGERELFDLVYSQMLQILRR